VKYLNLIDTGSHPFIGSDMYYYRIWSIVSHWYYGHGTGGF